MSFSYKEKEIDSKTKRYRIYNDKNECILFKDAKELLMNDHKFRKKIIHIFKKYNGEFIFFETKRYESDQSFEFVVITKDIHFNGDYSSFSDNINNESNVSSFLNLSGDTTLVIPNPVSNENDNIEYFGHLGKFMTYTDKKIKHDILKTVGIFMKDSVYLSTHGLGVPWLHFRISKKPKYYLYASYKKK